MGKPLSSVFKKYTKKTTIRQATIDDLREFFQRDTPTVRAWVGEENGEIVAIGGYARVGGRWMAFLDVTEEARKYKVTLVKTAKMVMDEADKQGIRYLYVEPDDSEPMARKWLGRMGFEYYNTNLLRREAR